MVGEAEVPLLEGPLDPEDQVRQREKVVEDAYKSRQMDLTASNNRLTRWIAASTVVSGIAAVYQGWWSNHSFEAEQRAYLYTENPQEMLGGWAVVRVPIGNSGHVVTKKTSLRVDFERMLTDGHVLEDRVIDVPTKNEIAPGAGTYALVIAMPHTSDADIAAINSGDQHLLLRGHFLYDSGFGKKDTLELCFGYQSTERAWTNCSGDTADIWLPDAAQRDVNHLPDKQ